MSRNHNYAYLSGNFMPYENILAPISLYAYGAYTTMKYSPEGLLFFDRHLERLKYNCIELNIKYPGDDRIIEGINRTLDENNYRGKDIIVRVTLFPESISWANPHEIKNTPCMILVTTREMYFLPMNFKLKTVNLTRNLPHLKTINYTVNFLAKAQAREAGYHDGLFINKVGHITEGTAWNIFFIRDSKVFTPSTESGILEGITRGAIINICNSLNIPFSAEEISLDSLKDFETAFITNSSQGPHAVMQINDIEYNIKNDTLLKLKEEYSTLALAKMI